MSIGPTAPQPQGPTRFENIQTMARKVVTAYFGDPFSYLLYLTLFGIVVALFCNYGLPWELYAITAGLTGVEIFKKINIKK